MSLITIEESPETIGYSADNCEYVPQFNVLDLLGLSEGMSSTGRHPDTFNIAEEENYNQLVVDWTILGRRQSKFEVQP